MTVVDAHLHIWNPESSSALWASRLARARSWARLRRRRGPDRDGWSGRWAGPARPGSLGPGRRPAGGGCGPAPSRSLSGPGHARFPRPQISPGPGAAWAAGTGLVGVRQVFPPGAAVSWLETGIMDWLWPAADEARLPVFVWAPGQLASLVRVLERHPTLMLVIDHLNLPMTGTASQVAAEVRALTGLARFPRAAVKASALPCLASDPYPYPSLRPLVRQVVDGGVRSGADLVGSRPRHSFPAPTGRRWPCSRRIRRSGLASASRFWVTRCAAGWRRQGDLLGRRPGDRLRGVERHRPCGGRGPPGGSAVRRPPHRRHRARPGSRGARGNCAPICRWSASAPG